MEEEERVADKAVSQPNAAANTPKNLKALIGKDSNQEVIPSYKGLPPLVIQNNSLLSKSRERIKKKKQQQKQKDKERARKQNTKGMREWKEKGFSFGKYK